MHVTQANTQATHVCMYILRSKVFRYPSIRPVFHRNITINSTPKKKT